MSYQVPHKIWFLMWEQFAEFATDFNGFNDDFRAFWRAYQTGSMKTNKIVISRHFDCALQSVKCKAVMALLER